MFLDSDISHGRISFSSSPFKIIDDVEDAAAAASVDDDADLNGKISSQSKIAKEGEISPKDGNKRTTQHKETSPVTKKEKKRKLPKFVNNSSSTSASSNSFKKPKPSIFNNGNKQ